MPKICIVGEAYGEEEDKLRFPFVGAAGRQLISQLSEAGILKLSTNDREWLRMAWQNQAAGYVKMIWEAHPEIFLTNVFNLRPKGNDIDTLCGSKADDTTGLPAIRTGKYIRAEFLSELDRLREELATCNPNIIVALGNTACWALLRNSGISKIRGTITAATAISEGRKLLPCYHPAAVLRDWSLRHVTVLDLQKAERESHFPEIRRPQRTVYIEPTLEDLEQFYVEHIEQCRLISFDIETSGDQITCIGFAPSPTLAIVVPFTDPRRSTGSYWSTLEEELAAWAWVRRVLNTPIPKVAQNGLYDVTFLWKQYGIPVRNFAHDTMLLHHSLQPESQKGLGFLGSVYTNEASWKLMRGKETIKRED